MNGQYTILYLAAGIVAGIVILLLAVILVMYARNRQTVSVKSNNVACQIQEQDEMEYTEISNNQYIN
ncbi:MAG: hypothetical protein LBH32_11655 [Dysgonamonadaceae bacterium]|jgi:hypothetical protein|nr:hypothetical protein [Dysgonamonadaceae bacterium]